MKIGDLVQVIPSGRVVGFFDYSIRKHIDKTGMIVNIEVIAGRTYYITLLEEQLVSVSNYNLRLL